MTPQERYAGMDIADIRKRYPQHILTGGMNNTHTLFCGTRAEIEAEARGIIDIIRGEYSCIL